MRTILVVLVFFALTGCQQSLSNKIDELSLSCGQGFDAGREYIKLENLTESSDLDVLGSNDSIIQVTEKGCIERPQSGEVYVTNKNRTKGLWINSNTPKNIELQNLAPKSLPTTCNTVIHGNGRGFNLNFNSFEETNERRLQSVSVKMFSQSNPSLIHAWKDRSLASVIDFQLPEEMSITTGEYLLTVEIQDRLTSVSSKSECTLRIDYTDLLVSPADRIKAKRNFNNQELLLVEAGYVLDFYVHQGFRDVTIDYCLKEIQPDDISMPMRSEITSCENTENFLNANPKPLISGFWIINYRAKRGVVDGGWQSAIIMVDKVCSGEFLSVKDVVEAGCTTIKGNLKLHPVSRTQVDNRDESIFKKLDRIGQISGDLELHSFDFKDMNYFPNLNEVSGALTLQIPETVTFRGFQSLKEVHGNLNIVGFRLESLDAFQQLKLIGNSFNLNGSPNLKQVNGFGSLRIIRGKFDLGRNALTNIFTTSLETVDEIDINNMPNLQDLSGFSNLKKVRKFRIYQANKIETIDGLQLPQELEALEINGTPLLKNLRSLRLSQLSTLLIKDAESMEELFDRNFKPTLKKSLMLNETNVNLDLSSLNISEEVNAEITSSKSYSIKGLENQEKLERLTLASNVDIGDMASLREIGSLLISLNGPFKPIGTLNSVGTLNIDAGSTSELKLNNISNLKHVNNLVLKNLSKIEFDFADDTQINHLELESLKVSNLEFLSNLKSVNELTIHLNQNLKTIEGIENVKIKGTLYLKNSSSDTLTTDFNNLALIGEIGNGLYLDNGVCPAEGTLAFLATKMSNSIVEPGYKQTKFPHIFIAEGASCPGL